MKAQELRIGNNAQDQDGNLLQCLRTELHGVVWMVVDRSKYPLPDGWKAEPIPLTEEWRIKLGLRNGWTGHFYFYSFEGSKLEAFYRTNGSKDIPIKYVHQLQNLYFALTGEELTIK